ncbi:MAG: hypothetical protein GX787_04355 [Tissierellia bacterium]|nr:hypothetical protein [Tissierellia bacterium]
MYSFLNAEFILNSDFEIRVVREDKDDIDLLIPLDLRTLNLCIDQMPSFIDNRFQFNEVRNIILRIAKVDQNNLCTIHLLNSVDIHSAIMNFTMNYKEHSIDIIKNNFSVDMHLRRKIDD